MLRGTAHGESYDLISVFRLEVIADNFVRLVRLIIYVSTNVLCLFSLADVRVSASHLDCFP